MNDEVVYFQLNNWFAGEHYPAKEPFLTWCGNDYNLQFDNEDWVKENKLVVVRSVLDMSAQWNITAPKSWVLKNCPDLINDPQCAKFIVTPDEENDDMVRGRWGTPFLPYIEENIGITWYDIYDDKWIDVSYDNNEEEEEEDNGEWD